MNPNRERQFLKLISGETSGAGAAVVRTVLGAVEPVYASLMSVRNALFDRRIRKINRLARPVISIGNITTGGTGKTPLVLLLANHLMAQGRNIAILSRGYHSQKNEIGDELTLLQSQMDTTRGASGFVAANPDRLAAGSELLGNHPEIDLFLLDDGFQHRQVARDLDIVLINATEPFGYGHVLPRGLLREPLAGLVRASAVILTHVNQPSPEQIASIEQTVRHHNANAPIYRAMHELTGLIASNAPSQQRPIEDLAQQRFFAFCGIGDPVSFDRQLVRFGNSYAGKHWFADHHQYTPQDLHYLSHEARSAGAEILVTTQKDWVKVRPIPSPLPVYSVTLRIAFLSNDEQRLLAQVDALWKGENATHCNEMQQKGTPCVRPHS